MISLLIWFETDWKDLTVELMDGFLRVVQ